MEKGGGALDSLSLPEMNGNHGTVGVGARLLWGGEGLTLLNFHILICRPPLPS